LEIYQNHALKIAKYNVLVLPSVGIMVTYDRITRPKTTGPGLSWDNLVPDPEATRPHPDYMRKINSGYHIFIWVTKTIYDGN